MIPFIISFANLYPFISVGSTLSLVPWSLPLSNNEPWLPVSAYCCDSFIEQEPPSITNMRFRKCACNALNKWDSLNNLSLISLEENKWYVQLQNFFMWKALRFRWRKIDVTNWFSSTNNYFCKNNCSVLQFSWNL